METRQVLFLITVIWILAWISAVVIDHFQDSSGQHESLQLHKLSNTPPFPDNKARFIHWFVQISDIHVSKFWDANRVSDLRTFCTENIDVIRPEVVMATGDLTDAKLADLMGSDQFHEEWYQYYQTLTNSGVLAKTVWLDVKGNHDTFNVPSLDSPLNYHRTHSIQGARHPSSYSYLHRTADGQQFSFIGVDATPIPGPKRPFNFFGILGEDSLKQLEDFSRKSRGSNASIWFGHYPSAILSDPKPFRRILRGAVYLSGHLHTLNNWMPKMYARHQDNGPLELELGDWKDNRIYRVLAVDHDLISFTDVKFGEWPVVLVTNPKDAQFIIPAREPTGRIRLSSHIRVLVFSPSPISEVKVTLDGVFLGDARQVEGPLYVLPWQPNEYTSGLHRIELYVKDSSNREKLVSHMFTLDDTRMPFDFVRRYILLKEQCFLVRSLFHMAFGGFIIFFVGMKIYASRNHVTGVVAGKAVYRYFHCWLRRFYLLVQTPGIFWSLLTFHLYVAIGPWFVAFLTDDHLGVMFVHGLYVTGHFIPGGLTWVHGLFQMVTFNLPLTLYLAVAIDAAVIANCGTSPRRSTLQTGLTHVARHGPFYAILLVQTWNAYGLYKAYGILSLLLGPVRTWSLLLALLLQQVAIRARPEQYRAKYHSVMSNGTTS